MAKYDWNMFRNYVVFLAGELAPGTRRPHHDSELSSCYQDAFLPWGHYHNNIVLFYHDSPITRSHFMDPTDRAIKGFYCTCCKALWLNCNCISFNRSKNMTPSPPIPRSAAPFCLLSKYPYRQITKDFAMRQDKNYVEWNGISIKLHQFVTNCPYQTKYSKHNICSYVFLLRFHNCYAGRLRNQIRTMWLWKTDT